MVPQWFSDGDTVWLSLSASVSLPALSLSLSLLQARRALLDLVNDEGASLETAKNMLKVIEPTL